ncbi:MULTISPECIES: glutamate-5-semialdehyde dehydrogenase [Cyanophyceae]|uniref:glutamate-5-semialdehyde dehydrogenase n=1 Tax=Cyanophyceae TaxID=3028117 RepID=UPI001683A37C|nr:MULTISPECIES: glutamate-5-semialdehyde dehydrogenase [Cyanophyceae]MBD1914915.1 glutamate-5-semialdehyde dehydrogenase [Phormidium sp. FACHB-77]MBD2028593.1 glutamate-5-semialdehyde dehydrogenase [Phormidium sp. FACHB-322]MBD2051763.1 glutamate-5-semialdehyde dehydrogenase [Leptolyngbya sp. FACHB-60]
MTVSPLAQDAATQPLLAIAQATRQAAQTLASLSAEAKNQAIEAVAAALEANADRIVAANQADCEAAMADNLAKPLYGRLKLDGVKLAGAIAGVRDVARLPDPVGTVQIHRELDEGLVLKRLAVPLGVLGVIFESRPDAVMQISALAIKSGNGVILKGGKEAVRSCTALVEAIKQGLKNAGVDPAAVQLLTTREETRALLDLEGYVDLIIPRGSNAFVRFVQENTRIPVLGHADGICHLYIDSEANLEQAVAIAVDAKTAYPSACNAIETLLIHHDIAAQGLPTLAVALRAAQVELRGERQAQQILPDLAPATEEDWATEYSNLILAIKVVDSVEEAIAHINTYGSRHTEAIATQNPATAAHFMDRVDAAGVYHNCSTRFADGFRYGFGAEVGISTQKMPPRGPVGLEGLVTYKYQLVGDGHVSTTYSGSDAKPFTHRDLA